MARAQDKAHSQAHNLAHTRGQSRGQALAAARPQDLAQEPQRVRERGQEPPLAPAGNQKRNREPCPLHRARGSAARGRQTAKRVTAQPLVGLAVGPPVAQAAAPAAGQDVAAHLVSLQMAGLAQQAAQAGPPAQGQALHPRQARGIPQRHPQQGTRRNKRTSVRRRKYTIRHIYAWHAPYPSGFILAVAGGPVYEKTRGQGLKKSLGV
ncbi:hypothetical protein KM92DES2_11080 [uncultured Desulfovibrio sp.]|uniref:Uncharacterized protein n=1 Tax=uncultured Desulfovibrio sp. TaxID=167968 RepID=A0A212JGS2_9BACT|nr:hypothetical protein KM92DES2_11080 [uncultured Desulfovibrio sp.]